MPLRLLTPSSAEDWKLSYLGKAGDDPQREASSRRSFNAVLRHCKSLFSRKVICKPNFGITVLRFPIKDPQLGTREVFWFETLGFENNGSVKFRAPNGVTDEGSSNLPGRSFAPQIPTPTSSYFCVFAPTFAGLKPTTFSGHR